MIHHLLVINHQLKLLIWSLKGGGSPHKLVRPGSVCSHRQFMGVAKDNSWVWSSTIYTFYSEYFVFLSIVNNCF